MEVEVDVVCNTSKAQVRIAICAAAGFRAFGNEDGVYLEHVQDSDTLRIMATAGTEVASTTVARTVGVSNEYALRFDGVDLKVFVDDVEITALRQEGYTIPAGQTGQTYIAVFANLAAAGCVMDNPRVYDW
jgi:hypothetical protein